MEMLLASLAKKRFFWNGRKLRIFIVFCAAFFNDFWCFFCFADHIELDAQVPASFSFSTCQRHFEATLLDFPHLCLQRD